MIKNKKIYIKVCEKCIRKKYKYIREDVSVGVEKRGKGKIRV